MVSSKNSSKFIGKTLVSYVESSDKEEIFKVVDELLIFKAFENFNKAPILILATNEFVSDKYGLIVLYAW